MRSRIMSGLMIVLLFVFTFSAVVAKGARITTPVLVSIAKEGSTKEAAFHDAMRKLWEDRITWTRLFIVSALADLAGQK